MGKVVAVKQRFNPDVGYLDEDNLRVAASAADWSAKKPRRIRDESVESFLTSEDWQRYLWSIDPQLDYFVTSTVKNVDRVSRRVTRDADGVMVWVTIPASLFVGLDRRRAQDVYRLLTRDTYVWGMTEFGWDIPPPVPGGVAAHAASIPLEVRGITLSETGRPLLADVEWRATSARSDLRVNGLTDQDRAWQDYLCQVNPDGETLFVLRVIDDLPVTGEGDAGVDGRVRHELVTEPDPETGEPVLSVETTVTAAALRAGPSESETAAGVVMDAYRWAAHKLGWPPPPA